MGTIEQEVKALLIRGKARFTGPDKLVTEWSHIFELNGEWLSMEEGQETFKRAGNVEHCRMCILGGVAIEQLVVGDTVETAAEMALENTMDEIQDSPFKLHTLEQVHAIYNKAIASIGDE